MLPGFPRLAGAKKILLWVGASTASTGAGADANLTTSINVPAGAQPGDLLVMLITATGFTDAQNIQTTTGWTSEQAANGFGGGVADYRLLTRVMQSGDTAWTIQATAAYKLLGTIHAWRNAAGIGNRRITHGSRSTANQISSTTARSALSVLTHHNDNGSTLPTMDNYPGSTTFAAAKTQTGVYASLHWSGYELNLPGGATGTRAFTLSNTFSSVYVLQEILAAP